MLNTTFGLDGPTNDRKRRFDLFDFVTGTTIVGRYRARIIREARSGPIAILDANRFSRGSGVPCRSVHPQYLVRS